jgi:hypothetical protein
VSQDATRMISCASVCTRFVISRVCCSSFSSILLFLLYFFGSLLFSRVIDEKHGFIYPSPQLPPQLHSECTLYATKSTRAYVIYSSMTRCNKILFRLMRGLWRRCSVFVKGGDLGVCFRACVARRSDRGMQLEHQNLALGVWKCAWRVPSVL